MKNPYDKRDLSKATSKPGAGQRVVVAMSGGVDSSVAALLLKEQGYDVIGISLQTTDYSKYTNDESGGTCCSFKDIEDARRVAESLDIPFYVLDTEKTFDANVVDYFVNEYVQGRTPNPCAMCNTKVKFNHLYKKSMDLGADFVATGHYAKISNEPDLGWALWRSTDLAKDQTYFLFSLTQTQLAKTLFPVGNLTKPEVRRLALERGLRVGEKPDSQEICFVPGHNYAAFVESRTSVTQRRPGKFITKDNIVLGDHEGVHRYTIGQRKGLGAALESAKQMLIPDADDFYVVKIDPVKATITLGKEAYLYANGLVASQMNWIAPPDLRRPRMLQARIRHRAEPAWAEVRVMSDNRVEVRFTEPLRAVTPGQAVVFYDGPLCLGGGWIDQPLNIAVELRPKAPDRLEGPTVLR
jgi:tRNA-uridine 2-sulfurtransferase